MTLILGISSFYHDSAASLISNGVILSAAQEERFTRVKHDASFPIKSIKWIIKTNSLKFEDIDYIVFYDKPFIKFDRLVETYIDQAPFGFNSFKLAMPLWLKEKLFLKRHLIKIFKDNFLNDGKVKIYPMYLNSYLSEEDVYDYVHTNKSGSNKIALYIDKIFKELDK